MSSRGFSLIETLVAVALLAVAVSALGHVFVLSTQANADARRQVFASVLASQKMEQLRGLGGDVLMRAGAAGTEDSLGQNIDGWCDFLDEYGRSLGGGTSTPAGTVYVRRWSINALPSRPTDAVLLQVIVIRRLWRGAVGGGAGAADPQVFGGAQLLTIKARRDG